RDPEQECVPTRNKEGDEGRMCVRILELDGEEVTLHVMNPDDRARVIPGSALRPGDANKQGPDQPRPGCHAVEVDIPQSNPRVPKRGRYYLVDGPEMLPRRDLRNDSSVQLVHVLRKDRMGQELALAKENRH